jgi:Ser/Thr protein kinase RdoA (MazF antagonist)
MARAEPASDSGFEILSAPSPALSLEEARRVSREAFGIDGPLVGLGGERDQNFRVQDASGDGRSYVLKIANPAEDPACLDLQRAALAHLAVHAPDLNVPAVRKALDGNSWTQVETENGTKHLAWLLSYLPGVPLNDVKLTPGLARNVGADLARLGVALRGFFHPAAGRVLQWDIKQVGTLRPRLDDVQDPARRHLAGSALERFEARALPILPRLRAQVIHADANGANVLVESRSGADGERISGFIDFGDMVHTALVNDLAVLLASVVTNTARPIADAAPIVAGYHSVIPLDEAELEILLELWLGRLLAAVLISAWRVKLHPENAPYITGDDEYSWYMIECLSALDPREVVDALTQSRLDREN